MSDLITNSESNELHNAYSMRWISFTVSDNRLEVHFGVSIPAIELDTAATSE